jgi:hypothetical protein
MQNVNKKEIATRILKASLDPTHYGNRCDRCGRRLKLRPGGLILWPLGGRFTECRSCGHENEGLLERAGITQEMLESAGIPTGQSNIVDLGECMGCEVEVQVSRDFTKIFCRRCGREWDRYQWEEDQGYALSPALAGLIPLKPDASRAAKKLVALQEANDIDASTPYLVIKLSEIVGKSAMQMFKEGWNSKKSADTPVRFVAVCEDHVALYTFGSETHAVTEIMYSDLFAIEDWPLPFNDILDVNEQSKLANMLLEFLGIFRANAAPYTKEVYGLAAQEIENSQRDFSSQQSITQELEKLVDPHTRGLLDAEEFASAKRILLNP